MAWGMSAILSNQIQKGQPLGLPFRFMCEAGIRK